MSGISKDQNEMKNNFVSLSAYYEDKKIDDFCGSMCEDLKGSLRK